MEESRLTGLCMGWGPWIKSEFKTWHW